MLPNPTKQDNYLDIRLQDARNFSVQVTDANGRTVYTIDSRLYSPGKHTVYLPMANMPAGTYFYSIINKNTELLSGGQIIKQ